MIRVGVSLLLAGVLTACAQYREPTVNCFAFVASSGAETDCNFQPLADRDETDDAD